MRNVGFFRYYPFPQHPILVDLFGDVDLPHHVPYHVANGFGLIERVFSVSLAGAGETPAVA